MKAQMKARVGAVFVAIALCGCTDFNRGMNYVLFVGVGTQLKAFRFIPAAGTLTEVSGSPISVGGTVSSVSSDLSATTIYVGEITTFKFKSYTVDPKTVALSVKSSTTYFDSPGGLCFSNTGGALVFAKRASITDLSSGAYVNSAGTLVIGGAHTVQGDRCIRRPSNPNQILYFYDQADLVTVTAAGVPTSLAVAASGQDGTETAAGDFLVTLDPGGPTIGTYEAAANTLPGINPSNLVVTGGTEIERLGNNFYVSTGAQNSVKAFQVSSTGILSLVATNTVTGTPSKISADPTETYLAVNAAATGTTTIYTTSSSGVLTAVASASTGVAAGMILELVGKRY